jgi:hypothetical protein
MPGTSQKTPVGAVVALVVCLVGIGGFFVGRQSSPAPPSVDGVQTATTRSFQAALVSLYPDGTGGCVAADPGQGVDTATDTHCGQFFVVPGFTPSVGARVKATPIDLRDANDEAVQGFLLAAP